jgi:hypothetical protein
LLTGANRSAKKEILNFKPASQLEQVGDQGAKQVKYGKHRMR